MNSTRLTSLILIVVLIAATGGALAYSTGAGKTWLSELFRPATRGPQVVSTPVSLGGHLVQQKVLQGSSGRVNLSLTLAAADGLYADTTVERNVDMVIVLDRSGSMKGRKLGDARQAVSQLLSTLTAKDRFALVTYSDGVQRISALKPVNTAHQQQLASAIAGVTAGGGTNLGAGLQAGIDVLLAGKERGNARKLVLISDGLANKGITDAERLGVMANIAVEKEFAVSTVGVGNDFNEQLMTAIADRGAGNYYYLENPMAFSEVFQKEFFYAQATVASNVSIWIPEADGLSVVDAAGYPIIRQKHFAVFYPGNLRSGQTRKLFLTVQVPTASTASLEIGNIKVRYRFNGQSMETVLGESFKIACVENKNEVQASIDKAAWTEKVIQEDYNRLKQEVAADVKAGKKQNALKKIHRYYQEQESINATVGSAEVRQNLDRDLKDLQQRVEDTFTGEPSAVSRKQKASSKALQYEGYKGRR
ncbi:MAG: VWA domain-containing protein [Deltaproteobacteria bacterium]|nr:VWA domain-containing protein [Deltaproteobacteria bacterium]